MIYSAESLSKLIKAVIKNEPCLREWDDLVSLTHDDPFTENMAQRLLSIQNNHSDISNHILIDEEGVKELEAILQEIEQGLPDKDRP